MAPSSRAMKILIVADDLTGANDSAVQFSETGLKAVTLLERGVLAMPVCVRPDLDVLAVSTESRNTSPMRAKEAVRNIVSPVLEGFPAGVVFKKIDSTLRGNIEAEITALVEILAVEGDIPIIFTPAYPSNGRTVSGGYALVDGVPLSRTFIGRDTLAPVKTSRVASVFTKRRMSVGEIGFSVIESGEDRVKAELRLLYEAKKSVIISDALTDDDLLVLVRSAMAVFPRVIWAGSAGMARALARVLSTSAIAEGQHQSEPERDAAVSAQTDPAVLGSTSVAVRARGRTLVLFGSLNPASAEQIDYARREGACRVIDAPDDLDPARTCEELASIIEDEVPTAGPRDIAIISAQVPKQATADEMARRVKAYFARVAEGAIREGKFSSLVLAGGDVGRAVLSRLRVSAMTIESEVLPGVAFGRACDGEAAGIGIVTKAGGFGDADALVDILSWLSTQGKVVGI